MTSNEREHACIFRIVYYLAEVLNFGIHLFHSIVEVRDCCNMRYSSALAVSVALFSSPSVSQGYTNQSEVPLYGLSPPVYPTREFLLFFNL
jgi:hypothetical protein